MTKTKTIAVGTTFKVEVHVRNMICAGTWWSISPLRRMYPCSPAVDLTSLCSLTSGYHSWGGEEAVVPKDFHPRRQDEGKTSLIHVHMHKRVYKLASSHPVVLFLSGPTLQWSLLCSVKAVWCCAVSTVSTRFNEPGTLCRGAEPAGSQTALLSIRPLSLSTKGLMALQEVHITNKKCLKCCQFNETSVVSACWVHSQFTKCVSFWLHTFNVNVNTLNSKHLHTLHLYLHRI